MTDIPQVLVNDPALWLSSLPRPQADGNKYTRGHALISGGYPITGAARMAARAAARAGAGLVTVAVPVIALPIYAAALTSIMVHPLVSHGDFDGLLADTRLSAFLIGPGAGTGINDHTRCRALAMLATGKPTVLDADAITVFQDDPTSLDQSIIGPCVLTPHEGEFRRIFDTTGDRLTRAQKAAKRSGAIINRNAPPTLATAGSGDVLSGIVLGLLAQGMEPFLASASAVWMHGAAANAFGPGLIAEDLPDLLPRVLSNLYQSSGLKAADTL